MPVTPTLTEVILAVHFKFPLRLTVMDLADWALTFSDEFPEVQQMPLAPRLDLVQPPTAFQVNFGQEPDLPRLLLRSPTKQFAIQLQVDRLAFGWTRATPLGDPTDYPGYDDMRASWTRLLHKFHDWHQTRLAGIPDARLVELTYHNAVPVEHDGHRKRLSEMFSFVRPMSREVNVFQVVWGENLSDKPDSPRVTAYAAMGTAPPDQVVFSFNFSGVGLYDGVATTSDAFGVLDALHERILDMRKAAIIFEPT